jgi:class 3 adenylate cyclase/HAMP domain-containing protein
MGIWFSYQETVRQLIQLQHEKAVLAATRIDLYVKNIEQQIDWTMVPLATSIYISPEQQRLEYFKLLRRVPAISDVSWIDSKGFEQLRVSRLEMDLIGNNRDRSRDPAFVAVKAGQTFYGPVYFRNETEPYLTIARSAGNGSVSIAEINLKFIWDVISGVHVGQTGLAYATDVSGTLIAHPDIGQVLKKTSLSTLPQVAKALGGRENTSGHVVASNLAGQEMITAHAPIPALHWHVFVELPTTEAFAPLREMLLKSGLLLLVVIALSVISAILLARQMAEPIRQLSEGANRIKAGQLDQRIEVHSGDELEVLASQFNEMANSLQDSYETLEQKVKERTDQLAQEQAKSRSLLTNILPESVIGELFATGQVQPTRHEEVTVLFADLVNFTNASASMPASRMVGELNEIFEAFDEITYQEGVEKIKTIGDAYMAAAGLSGNTFDHAQRCTRAALRMAHYLEERNQANPFKWQVRIGLHSGSLVSGVVGKRKYAFDIWGDTVNLASRVQSASEAGRINVSAYTFDLIQREFNCSYRGKLAAKGKGDIDMYFVDSMKAADME